MINKLFVHVGPLHKIQGYQGHRNVIKCSPHHNGDICTTRGNNLKTSFSYMSQNVQKMYILANLGGPEGVFNDQTGQNLAFQPSSHPYPCRRQIRKQSVKKFLSLNPKYEKKYILFFIFGGSWGPLCQTQANEYFRAVRPHHRADICITMGKNNCQFFIYGPQYTKMCIFCYSGGPGLPINNRTQLSPHLYQSTYHMEAIR